MVSRSRKFSSLITVVLFNTISDGESWLLLLACDELEMPLSGYRLSMTGTMVVSLDKFWSSKADNVWQSEFYLRILFVDEISSNI